MHNNRSHPLLEQVPLTVSPFVSLPTATTLSYNYKTMPSNIPPSALGLQSIADDGSAPPFPRFVVSGSGHAASPEEVGKSCRELLHYLVWMNDKAEEEIGRLETRLREEELKEKRRLAPGWLDRDERMLEPERVAAHQEQPTANAAPAPQDSTMQAQQQDAGAELDRAFGNVSIGDVDNGQIEQAGGYLADGHIEHNGGYQAKGHQGGEHLGPMQLQPALPQAPSEGAQQTGYQAGEHLADGQMQQAGGYLADGQMQQAGGYH
ncbi:hypothetical protein CDD81_5203 [Ophiocordyceps australis]|uniref:Uncharacterized protein n=1 Tax=Ophiocordyceps australis TaxID=1399860 RepID=A0A2C5XMZ3_9HYPO|nr:hypothetical protein CDD81_5203 [Ophiocordyceps australis]